MCMGDSTAHSVTVGIQAVGVTPDDIDGSFDVCRSVAGAAGVPPLRLIGEPRIERYELAAPDGTVVEVTHNIDTGEASYLWTDRRGTPLSTGA